MEVVAWQESLTTTERARNSVGLRSTDTTIYDWGWLNWVNILLRPRPCMKSPWRVPEWGSLFTRTLSGTGGWWRRRTRTWRSSSPRSRRTPPTGAPAGWSGSSRCSETCQMSELGQLSDYVFQDIRGVLPCLITMLVLIIVVLTVFPYVFSYVFRLMTRYKQYGQDKTFIGNIPG